LIFRPESRNVQNGPVTSYHNRKQGSYIKGPWQALGRLRQEDCESEARMDYIVARPCLKKDKQTKNFPSKSCERKIQEISTDLRWNKLSKSSKPSS
jgi:hypothetical protein